MLIKDESFETVLIKEKIENGYTDTETGQWVSAGEKLVATCEADIQPSNSNVKHTETQTEFESDHIMFVNKTDINYEDSYSKIKKGYAAIDETGNEYDIVFSGDWLDHLEIELKRS